MHRELAVEVRVGTLPLRSGWEPCRRELAVEVRVGTLPSGGGGEGEGGGGEVADIKPNHPHLTGG